MKPFPEIRNYYKKQWYIIFILPFFNLFVFFIRFAGIINSINTNSAWKTKNFTEERQEFRKKLLTDFGHVEKIIGKIRGFVNTDPID